MWNFKETGLRTIDDLYDFCQNITYGWIDRVGQKHYEPNSSEEYFLQSPGEVLQNKIGICWDQTELQRAWFVAHGYDVKTYFLYYYINDNNCPSHSIMVFRDGNKYCWFEPMFQTTKLYALYSGIHKYDTLEGLLERFYTRFMQHCREMRWLSGRFNFENVELYEYNRPEYGISGVEFYDHCRTGRKISLKR